MITLSGSCHCGTIGAAFKTTCSPGELQPRACDCSFCEKHAAQYLSDPEGDLMLSAKSASHLGRYRQGSNSADFLFCTECGVLMAVTCEMQGKTFGAVNARVLMEFSQLASAQVVSPQKLAKPEKLARWQEVWTRQVRIELSED